MFYESDILNYHEQWASRKLYIFFRVFCRLLISSKHNRVRFFWQKTRFKTFKRIRISRNCLLTKSYGQNSSVLAVYAYNFLGKITVLVVYSTMNSVDANFKEDLVL